MELNDKNYFSKESMRKYLSVSQYKDFVGCPARSGCEKRALARLSDDYVEEEKSDALLLGSYVDVALTGTADEMQQFIEENPSIISSRGTTKGELKAPFKIADTMIERVHRDELFMKTLSGEHQVIMVGEIFGVPWKIKVDSLLDNAIVDLKTCKSITETYYDPSQGKKISFIEYFDYITQGAVYQEIVRHNTGKTLPFFLSCVSKEKVPDIEVIQIDNDTLAERLAAMEDSVKNIQMLKNGEIEPTGCGICDFCRERKVLTSPISWLELGGELN